MHNDVHFRLFKQCHTGYIYKRFIVFVSLENKKINKRIEVIFKQYENVKIPVVQE